MFGRWTRSDEEEENQWHTLQSNDRTLSSRLTRTKIDMNPNEQKKKQKKEEETNEANKGCSYSLPVED